MQNRNSLIKTFTEISSQTNISYLILGAPKGHSCLQPSAVGAKVPRLAEDCLKMDNDIIAPNHFNLGERDVNFMNFNGLSNRNEYCA